MGRLSAAVCALALLFSGAVAVRAQDPEGGEQARPEKPRRVMPPINRFTIVLDHKADLALTTEQVTKLDGMRTALADQNKPLEDEVRSIVASTKPGAETGTNVVDRDVAAANFERIKKVRDQVQKNDKDAWKEGEKVLTKDQKKKADKLISEKEDEQKEHPGFQGRRGSPMSGRGGRGGRGGMGGGGGMPPQ
jgi:hypothetical protein